MLVNTVQGLSIIDKSRQDLMKTYSASYFSALLKLRLPSALPFIFNGLKNISTLALIGAIVAEFFGSQLREWISYILGSRKVCIRHGLGRNFCCSFSWLSVMAL